MRWNDKPSIVVTLDSSSQRLVAVHVEQRRGVGAALLVPQVLTGIQLNFSGDARTCGLGFYSVALSIGAVVRQVLGGVIISANMLNSGWRPIFLINLPIGAVVMIAALRFLPPHHGGKPRGLDLWPRVSSGYP